MPKYEAPLPRDRDGAVAYQAFNIARDVLNQFFADMKLVASQAPKEE